MQSRETSNGFLIRLARGEKVIETLTRFCAERGIGSGTLCAIGAIMDAELGYYDLAKRQYFFFPIAGTREVASMNGTIAVAEGAPTLHIHTVLSAGDETLACAGGHLKEATVAVTLEVSLVPDAEPVERRFDDETGLSLMSL
ncbi:MAG TPA: DUF296 domain-containing protein [Candidatus Paceibacterota bacterium]|nr:DUF296 domain-containing protein [Candidatus Paceibacterota bacterium]